VGKCTRFVPTSSFSLGGQPLGLAGDDELPVRAGRPLPPEPSDGLHQVHEHALQVVLRICDGRSQEQVRDLQRLSVPRRCSYDYGRGITVEMEPKSHY
jgi:hypothetical protein